MPGGWIYCGQRVVQSRGKMHKGAPVRVVLSSSFSSAVSPRCASVGAARSHAAICGRNEMASKCLVSWRSLLMCWVCVAYVAIPWWAAGVTDQPVIRSGRCSSPVSRATLMSFGTLVTIYIYIYIYISILFNRVGSVLILLIFILSKDALNWSNVTIQ